MVTKLSSDLEHGYYNINFDNFFPSFGQMKTLLDKRINRHNTTKSKQVSSTVEDCEASPWQVYCNALLLASGKTKRYLTSSQQTANQMVGNCAMHHLVSAHKKNTVGVDYANHKRGDYKILLGLTDCTIT